MSAIRDNTRAASGDGRMIVVMRKRAVYGSRAHVSVESTGPSGCVFPLPSLLIIVPNGNGWVHKATLTPPGEAEDTRSEARGLDSRMRGGASVQTRDRENTMSMWYTPACWGYTCAVGYKSASVMLTSLTISITGRVDSSSFGRSSFSKST